MSPPPPPPDPGATAVLCNPASGGVGRRIDGIRRVGGQIAGDAYREAVGPGEIAAAVETSLAGGCRVLCVVGGDGTVHATLTALDRLAGGAPWPALAVVPAGTANVTATDLGARGSASEALESLQRWHRGREAGLRLVRRPVLRVERPGGAPLCGLFFGAGAVAAGVRYFRTRLDRLPLGGEGLSAVAVGRVLLDLARGRATGGAAAPTVRISLDGGPERRRRGLLFLVSTLDRLLLGTRPYWGRENAPLRYTLVEEGARRLWRNLPRLALGRPGRALAPENGYHSRNVHRLAAEIDAPWVVDGELYGGKAPERLHITAPHTPEWLIP